MKEILILISAMLLLSSMTCNNQDDMNTNVLNTSGVEGYELLTDLTGHWVGSNDTAFGPFDWFTFDFRPISASHVHSIYEGGTNQNIITSIFIADYDGQKRIMARNGGWLGNQYRATYFVLDKAEINGNTKYYRLVDAVGREKRAYIEFRFEGDTFFFDAYKDNSGSLDEPIHHMEFKGTNFNPMYAQEAIEFFDFPQAVSEVNLEGKFVNLIDPDSALFLEEDEDPFPKSQHGYLSDLKININKAATITEDKLLLYLSTEPIVDENGQVNFDNLENKVVRTIDIQANESFYETTYLHPDNYFITAFTDKDKNDYPSQGDISNVSQAISITPEKLIEMDITVDMLIQ